MVGSRRCCNFNYQTTSVWKDIKYGYAEVLFSNQYAGRADLFEELYIWNEEKYRRLQGEYPVISVSFADVKEQDYESAIQK